MTARAWSVRSTPSSTATAGKVFYPTGKKQIATGAGSPTWGGLLGSSSTSYAGAWGSAHWPIGSDACCCLAGHTRKLEEGRWNREQRRAHTADGARSVRRAIIAESNAYDMLWLAAGGDMHALCVRCCVGSCLPADDPTPPGRALRASCDGPRASDQVHDAEQHS